MSNPFLFDDDGEADVATDAASNPFLQDAAIDSTTEFETSENPFFSETAQAVNPFADYVAEVTSATIPESSHVGGDIVAPSVVSAGTAENVDSAMSFFGTTIKDEEDEEHGSQSTYAKFEQKEVDHVPPPRPNPPSQTTQQLILTIADQLDQTSSHLLGRIPVTRTPSPVSMRDLHTPSPTPDNADLLDVTENLEFNQTDSNVGNGLSNDNPFSGIDD